MLFMCLFNDALLSALIKVLIFSASFAWVLTYLNNSKLSPAPFELSELLLLYKYNSLSLSRTQ